MEMLDENVINVKIHPSNLCESVLPAPQRDSHNEVILEELLSVVNTELQTRKNYFRKYSNEI